MRICEAGNLTVCAELIQAKADVNMPEPDIGVTPLIGAANAGHLDVCKILIEGGVHKNPMNQNGDTPLNVSSHQNVKSFLIQFAQM